MLCALPFRSPLGCISPGIGRECRNLPHFCQSLTPPVFAVVQKPRLRHSIATMKLVSALLPACVLLSACSSLVETDKFASLRTPEARFDAARAVLETNCVHCHDDTRLSTMPPIADTAGLAKLIATGWITPGHPEKSRFFQVVTLSDETPGAMPPTGHAISPREVQILRQWIQDGAKLPKHNVKLQRQGALPRSV